MTMILRIPAPRSEDAFGDGWNVPDCADGVWMRAQWRQQATVVMIGGVVDALTSDRVRGFATRFVLVGNAVALDLGGVEFFSARGVSVLFAVADACATAAVPWALIPSPVVRRVLRLTGCEACLPTAESVPEAMRRITALPLARRCKLVSRTATDPTAGSS